MIKENFKVPNFKLPSSNNKTFEINKSLKQYLVIYFYPRDNTPGCTNEAKDFSKLYKEFKKLNCDIFGISKDSVDGHKKFISKFKIPFQLLSDEKIVALKKYGAWGEKSMYGKEIVEWLNEQSKIQNNKFTGEYIQITGKQNSKLVYLNEI